MATERMKFHGMCVCGHIEEEHDGHECNAVACWCAGFEPAEDEEDDGYPVQHDEVAGGS